MAYLILFAVVFAVMTFSAHVWRSLANGRKHDLPRFTISDLVAPGKPRVR